MFNSLRLHIVGLLIRLSLAIMPRRTPEGRVFTRAMSYYSQTVIAQSKEGFRL